MQTPGLPASPQARDAPTERGRWGASSVLSALGRCNQMCLYSRAGCALQNPRSMGHMDVM